MPYKVPIIHREGDEVETNYGSVKNLARRYIRQGSLSLEDHSQCSWQLRCVVKAADFDTATPKYGATSVRFRLYDETAASALVTWDVSLGPVIARPEPVEYEGKVYGPLSTLPSGDALWYLEYRVLAPATSTYYATVYAADVSLIVEGDG